MAPLKKRAGRNHQGKITVRHHGGGHKRQYRIIDFKRNKDGIPAKVATIEYDPNRSARIALLHYADGEKRYIIAPHGMKVGDVVVSGPDADIRRRQRDAAGEHSGRYGHPQHRAAAWQGWSVGSRGWCASAQLMAKEGEYAQVRLTSGEVRLIRLECRATIGQVGNLDHENINIGKAGRSRWLGRARRFAVS